MRTNRLGWPDSFADKPPKCYIEGIKKLELSDDEQKLLAQYQTLSNSMPSFANRIAVEIIPPAIFVGIGLYTGQTLWFLLLISIMVFYNLQRVIRQYKNIARLKSISEKTIGSQNDKSAEETSTSE